jgi:hypothetical protein
MRLVEGQPFTTPLDLFITIVDAPVFGGNMAHGSVFNVPAVDNLTVGGDFQHISMTLGTPTALFFNRPVHWMPVDPNGNPTISFEFNSQGVPTEEMGTFMQIYEMDNVQLVLDIATSLALVVDPTSGNARIRNVSDADVTFDYYRIESTNGSLLSANFNGTTGWNSLDDQGIDSMGPGVGESWEEVVAANTANRLVEQYLLGETTLSPGQSVSLGAPVSPAILNNQINTLALRFGGASYDAEGFGQVLFENLSGLAGDYSGNGVVDAADFVAWRNDPSAFGGAAGYDTWKANFGKTLGAGSVASVGNVAAVPEPTAVLACSLAMCLAAGARVQRARAKD